MKTVHKITKQAILIALAFVLLLTCATGCSKGQSADENAGRDTLIVATSAEHSTLHPYSHNELASFNMNQLTYATLFRRSAEDLEPVPYLVDTYEVLDDTTWQFTLHDGIKFHNGETMTSEDVKASVAYSKEFPEGTLYTSLIDDVEVVDDLTFKIHLTRASSQLLEYLTEHALVILPKSLIDAGHDFNEDPVGAGPYKLVEWVTGESITFEAFDEFFLEECRPKIKTLKWEFIPEGAARTVALEAGEVDLLYAVAASDIPHLQETDGIEVRMGTGVQLSFMVLNQERTDLHFDDALVRRAIDMAINKQAIVDGTMDGFAQVTYAQTAETFRGSSLENVNSYDPDGARALLEEAGIADGELNFSILVGSDSAKTSAEIIQSDLKEIGIGVSIEQQDHASFMSATSSGNFQAAIASYSAYNAMTYLYNVWYSGSINTYNKARMANDDVDALILGAIGTSDMDESYALQEQCTALLNELTAQIPLYLPYTKIAYKSTLDVPEVNPAGAVRFELISWK